MKGCKRKNEKTPNYNIGLDIGTNSVGYAVTDDNGNLLKFKGKNMWGVNLFDKGDSAQKTRLARCNRRRLDRRKNRINLLQQLMAKDVLSIDDAFFIKLSQSSLWGEDRSFSEIYTLFNDKDFNEVDYYNKFPTIYHLRRYLMNCEEKADIRLIYLALHHIVKYRGNFLYEDQNNISAENSQLLPAVSEFFENFEKIYEIENTDELSKQIADILKSSDAKKQKKLMLLFHYLIRQKTRRNFTKILQVQWWDIKLILN